MAMGRPIHLPNSRALRRGRCSVEGQAYLLTTPTHQRRPFFSGWQPAASVCALLGGRRLFRDSQPLCWVLMPDHLHLLVGLGHSESLPSLVGRVKAVTSRGANLVLERRGHRVWMPGYHDHALRRDEDLLSVARYIVLNPVRAGLVRKVRDYPFWDAAWL